MIDYRFVYVFKVKGKDLYKIGISKDWRKRQKQVQRTKKNGDKLRLIIALPLIFASYIEQRLHKKFAKNRKHLKGVSGGTEFFKLNNYDGRIGLRGELLKYFILQSIVLIFIFMTIVINLLGWNWYDYFDAIMK